MALRGQKISKTDWLEQVWGELRLDPNQDFPNFWSKGTKLRFRFLCSCGEVVAYEMKIITKGLVSSCGNCERVPISPVDCHYCGGKANFLVGKSGIPCCDRRQYDCPAYERKLKSRATGGPIKGSVLIVEPCLVACFCIGCGQLANFLVGKGKVPCCKDTPQQCPVVQEKQEKSRKGTSVQTEELCYYGCGQVGRFLIGKIKRICCNEVHSRCPQIHRNKEATYLERFGGNPNKTEAVQEKRRLAFQKRLGVDNNFELEETREKSKVTMLERYGVNNYAKSPDFNEKRRVTSLERYGTEHPMGNAKILDKSRKSAFQYKTFMLPSGKEIRLQGYEPQVLKKLLHDGVLEGDFDFENVPPVTYQNPSTGESHTYHPDFYLSKYNRLIETKSLFTLFSGYGSENLNVALEKARAARAKGYDLQFIVWDDNKQDILSWDSESIREAVHLAAKQDHILDKGYQRRIREIYAVLENKPTILNLKDAYVEEITKSIAVPLILKYEWKEEKAAMVVAYYGLKLREELLGVVCFSRVGGAPGSICSGYESKTICLSRGACVYYAPKNAASFLISHACKMAHEKYGWSIFFAYSDSQAGEIGTVYQASNWLYLGKNVGRSANAYHSDFISPTGEVIKSYTLNHDKGKRLLQKLGWTPGSGKKKRQFLLDLGWTRIKDQGKGKWVWFEGTHKERKTLLSCCKFSIVADGLTKPYPKRSH
jgi:hypothetical protein